MAFNGTFCIQVASWGRIVWKEVKDRKFLVISHYIVLEKGGKASLSNFIDLEEIFAPSDDILCSECGFGKRFGTRPC